METLLRVEGQTKRFPHVIANDDISFDVTKGEIHCLLGENGAGKSTLAECIYGAYRPDAGEIILKGQQINLQSPRDAIDLGIGMVHQHFVLIPPMTVLENIVVGTDSPGLFLDRVRASQTLTALCRTYGIDLDLNTTVADLSVSQQQWVEILKALYGGVELLILDEPTAVLRPQETEKLFSILGKMKRQGIAILLITHKLKEVMQISDRVTVLRRGRRIATVDTSEVTREDLARMMVGREVVFRVEKDRAVPGDPVLTLEEVSTLEDDSHQALSSVTITLHQREIMGLAGVAANGQRSLYDVIVGVSHPSSG
jgi:simple sugar transport system ATP-binding protein